MCPKLPSPNIRPKFLAEDPYNAGYTPGVAINFLNISVLHLLHGYQTGKDKGSCRPYMSESERAMNAAELRASGIGHCCVLDIFAKTIRKGRVKSSIPKKGTLGAGD